MKQDHVHQYVLEHVAGLPAHLRRANRVVRITATVSILLAAGVMALTIFGQSDFELGMQLALAMLVAGFPFGILAQRFTARKVLHRHNLKITRFLIGKKEYLVPDHGTLNHELDIFAAASSLVGSAESLETAKHAAAWHTYQVTEDSHGVAICLGWFGPAGKPYAFMYGDTRSITELTSEVWDLGHVRRIHETDESLYAKTANAWRKQSTLPVAVAFAALPQDTNPDNVTLADIKEHSTLLGLLQLQGTRDGGRHTFNPQLISATRTTAHMQLVTSLTLLVLLLVSFIINIIWSIPPVLGLIQTAVISAALLPLLLSSLSWDGIKHHYIKSIDNRFSDALFAATLIAGLGFVQFFVFIARNEQVVQSVTKDSTIHNAALASVLLTIIGCFLIELFIRRSISIKANWSTINPLFMLALASALLLSTLTAYATGPLLGKDLLFVGGGISAYLFFRTIQRYASRHHTREHIVELLTQR